jgi:hypothetical protein
LAHRIFAPDKGGTFEIWKHRPFLPVLVEYMTDVRYFHLLRDTYAVPRGLFWHGVEAEFAAALGAAVHRRIEAAICADYTPNDRDANTLADPILVAAIKARKDDTSTIGIGPNGGRGGGGVGAGSKDGRNDGRKADRRKQSHTTATTALPSSTGNDTDIRSNTSKPHTTSSTFVRPQRTGSSAAGRTKSTQEIKAIVAAHIITALKPYLKNGTIANSVVFKTIARELTSSVVSAGTAPGGSGSSSSDGHGGPKPYKLNRAWPPHPSSSSDTTNRSNGFAPVVAAESCTHGNTATEDSPLFGVGEWDIAPATKATTKAQSRAKTHAKAKANVGSVAHGRFARGSNDMALSSSAGDTRSSLDLERAAIAAVRIKMCDLDPLMGIE